MADDIALFTVAVTDTVRTAMERITENRHRVVVVLDGHKVVGTVSDGDIRRALLREVLLIAPVSAVMNVSCKMTQESDPARQQALIQQLKVTVLPVVDNNGELLDIVEAYEPFSRETTNTSPTHDC